MYTKNYFSAFVPKKFALINSCAKIAIATILFPRASAFRKYVLVVLSNFCSKKFPRTAGG